MFWDFSLVGLTGFSSRLAKNKDLCLLYILHCLCLEKVRVCTIMWLQQNEEELRNPIFLYMNLRGLLNEAFFVLCSVYLQLVWTVVDTSACTGTCSCSK